jgi:hypothetical protein
VSAALALVANDAGNSSRGTIRRLAPSRARAPEDHRAVVGRIVVVLADELRGLRWLGRSPRRVRRLLRPPFHRLVDALRPAAARARIVGHLEAVIVWRVWPAARAATLQRLGELVALLDAVREPNAGESQDLASLDLEWGRDPNAEIGALARAIEPALRLDARATRQVREALSNVAADHRFGRRRPDESPRRTPVTNREHAPADHLVAELANAIAATTTASARQVARPLRRVLFALRAHPDARVQVVEALEVEAARTPAPGRWVSPRERSDGVVAFHELVGRVVAAVRGDDDARRAVADALGRAPAMGRPRRARTR